VGAVAVSGKVVSGMTVGAMAMERRVREPVLDSPVCFKPRAVSLKLSGFGIDLDALCHGKGLGSGDGCGVVGKGTGDVFPLRQVGVKVVAGLGSDEALAGCKGLHPPVGKLLFQGSPLAQQVFVLQHVTPISVNISGDPIVPEFK
jgi:hypothetical protein